MKPLWPGDVVTQTNWCARCVRWTTQTSRVLAHAAKGVRYALSERECGDCGGLAI